MLHRADCTHSCKKILQTPFHPRRYKCQSQYTFNECAWLITPEYRTWCSTLCWDVETGMEFETLGLSSENDLAPPVFMAITYCYDSKLSRPCSHYPSPTLPYFCFHRVVFTNVLHRLHDSYIYPPVPVHLMANPHPFSHLLILFVLRQMLTSDLFAVTTNFCSTLNCGC